MRRAVAAALAALLVGAAGAAAQDTGTTTVEIPVPTDTIEIPVPEAPATTSVPAPAPAPVPAPALQPRVAAPVRAAPLPNTGGAPWLIALSGLALLLIGAGVRLRVSQDPEFGHM